MNMNKLVLSVIMAMTLLSCDTIFPDQSEPTPTEVFDEFWNAVNQKYVNFINRNVDWDAVYAKYRGYVWDDSDDDLLFLVLGSMLDELKDGHVNLFTEMDFWPGHLGKADGNKAQDIVDLYLGGDCKRSGGLRFNTIRQGKVGYVECASFQGTLSDSQFDEVLDYCKDCQGLILDLRGNVGGELPSIMTLLKCLPCEKELYKTFVRNSADRNELVQEGVMLRPDDIDENRIWRKPFIVLIDNYTYSASSTFAMCVKGFENVRLVGVKTAGGTNTPLFYELSNGWVYRLPSVKYISKTGADYQNGVPPDVEIHLDPDAVKENKDNLIETACEMIESGSILQTTRTAVPSNTRVPRTYGSRFY